MTWVKKNHKEIKEYLFTALSHNINYHNENIIGVPASYLDEKVFNQDKFDLHDAPFLSTLLQNPNHIGCHTLGSSESFFSGTQQIERDVIEICANDILKGGEDKFDGYVASGGTEANIQAIWIYRNYFMQNFKASLNEITVLCSSDSHYSMPKGSNVLGIQIVKAKVDFDTREISKESVQEAINEAKSKGAKYFIVVSNMMTTMFGSVDDVDVYTSVLLENQLEFKLHIDGAYGGFYYPFSNKEDDKVNFKNPYVTSVTLDAHKMAQAPYGTGIFVVRKGFMQYATTMEASYVEGEDCTLIGSRSGANAISIWMILSTYGPFGWDEKILILQNRTSAVCKELENLGIEFYRNSHSNLITMKANYIPKELVVKYGLVPDNHHNPSWYKIVVMEHVTMEKLTPFIEDLKKVY